jgi:hypothetical protein
MPWSISTISSSTRTVSLNPRDLGTLAAGVVAFRPRTPNSVQHPFGDTAPAATGGAVSAQRIRPSRHPFRGQQLDNMPGCCRARDGTARESAV